MLTFCWSPKGGSGTTVVATALALLTARHAPTILFDAGGDVPAVLGLGDVAEPGLLDWFAAPHATADDLFRLAVPAVDDLLLVTCGDRTLVPPTGDDWARLVDACAARPDLDVMVDIGTAPPPTSGNDLRVLLVTRPCYLALRRAVRLGPAPTAVVVVTEPGRALGRTDVERALEAPVVAEIPWDPAIARAVDAGLFAGRIPASMSRPLRGLSIGSAR